jgi:DNA-binding MarR family transcriptional regulator
VPVRRSVNRMNAEQRLDLATRVLDDIRRIFQELRISARRAEQELGISGAQLFVLQKLADQPAASLNELAERTLTHQSSVSVVVRRLVERGLVARDRSGDDARRIELRLTSSGRRLLRQVPTMPQIQLVETVRSFPDRDLQLLARLMRQLAKAIRAAGQHPQMFFSDPATARAASSKPLKKRPVVRSVLRDQL